MLLTCFFSSSSAFTNSLANPNIASVIFSPVFALVSRNKDLVSCIEKMKKEKMQKNNNALS